MASNIRQAPAYITPKLVERVLDTIASPPPLPAPVQAVPVSGDKPQLALVPQSRQRLPFARSRPAALQPAPPSFPARAAPSIRETAAGADSAPLKATAESPSAPRHGEPAATNSPPPAQRPLAGSIFAYAERIAGAREYLQARHFTVRRHDREAVIAKWEVSGHVGVFDNEELVELARRHGWSVRG